MPTPLPPRLPPGLLVQGITCVFLYTPLSWWHTSVYAPVVPPLTFWRACTECQMWGRPAPSRAALPW